MSFSWDSNSNSGPDVYFPDSDSDFDSDWLCHPVFLLALLLILPGSTVFPTYSLRFQSSSLLPQV
jgi:hypothetical protein